MKAFLLSLLFSLQLFACALCSMYTPSGHVTIAMDINETMIKTADIEWRFTGEFTKTLLPQYDNNGDGKFDAEELKMVESALLDYVKPLNFLTTVKYHDKEIEQTFDEVEEQKIDVNSYKVSMKEGEVYLNYQLRLGCKLKNGYVLFIGIFDDGGFMNFLIGPDGVKFTMPQDRYISANPNMNMVYFEIMAEEPKVETNATVPVETKIVSENTASEETAASSGGYVDFLSKLLADISDEVKSYLFKIKYSQSSMAFFSLMLFSFLYGLVHAAGPGHGYVK